MPFKALLLSKTEDGQNAALADLDDDVLMEGDVTVAVSHSTLNYKDALAITGRAPVVRRWPLIAGIDFAGTVIASNDPRWREGDRVLINGWGIGETHHGGLAERARVPGDWLMRVPETFDAAQAMAIGTAGYTAMLCTIALERHGIMPGSGPIVVTGAAGGVGSIAVALLARLGYTVEAVTGRAHERAYLEQLGATGIIDRSEIMVDPRPLHRERFAAGVDAVGGQMLANLLGMIGSGGAVAACGNAGGMDLPASVAPFILRGVSLLGINSVTCPQPIREEAWSRLARDLDPTLLESTVRHIALADAVEVAGELVEGRVRGRVVVDIA